MYFDSFVYASKLCKKIVGIIPSSERLKTLQKRLVEECVVTKKDEKNIGDSVMKVREYKSINSVVKEGDVTLRRPNNVELGRINERKNIY